MKKKPIPKEPDRKPEINVFIGVRLDVGEFSKLTERQILAFAEGLAKIWASLGK